MFSKKNKKIEDTTEKENINTEKSAPKEVKVKETEVRETKEKTKEEEYLDELKRCRADFENYRKRQDERLKELGRIFKEDLFLQLLPVLDNFQMSLNHVPENQRKSPWLQGILHIQRQLESILKENGIEEIEAKVGDKFDPNYHEAISHSTNNIEHETKKEVENKITEVVSRGYKIGDKVIRAVKVIVE